MLPGAINLASRALPCLPSALFEIHLGIKPEPLKSVPVEPPITTGTSDDVSASRTRAGTYSGPSWYEAQDLEVIKAWSNEILEIQPELSMFGSLKTIDVSTSYGFCETIDNNLVYASCTTTSLQPCPTHSLTSPHWHPSTSLITPFLPCHQISSRYLASLH